MGQFFVSYKRENDSFAEHVCEKIDAQPGLSHWRDNKIYAGERWAEKIDNQIIHSLGIIVIITDIALVSHYITYEWSFALALNKPIIPLIVECTDNKQMHKRLHDQQWVDFRGSDFWDDANPIWIKLFEALQVFNHKNNMSPMHTSAVQIIRSSTKEVEWRETIITLRDDTDPKAIEVLADEIHNSLPQKAYAIGLALAQRTGYKDQRAIAGLCHGLYFGSGDVGQAANALGRIGGEQATKFLLDSVDRLTNDRALREIIVKALAMAAHISAKSKLEELLNDTYYDISRFAAIGLGNIGSPESVPAMLNVLEDTSRHFLVRSAIAEALGKIGDVSAVQSLIKIANKYYHTLGGEDLNLIYAAINALGAIGGDQAREALSGYSRNNNYAPIRDQIITLLDKIQHD